MAKQGWTTQGDKSVEDFIASLPDEQIARDSLALFKMMRRISRHRPKMWNVGTSEFDAYHYKCESGREGDCQALGAYPRKRKMTVYLMEGTARHSELLTRLGKHSTSRGCLSIRRLSDVQPPILEQVLRTSYEYLKSKDGHTHRFD
jgi:hypothetical protein